MKTIFRIIFYRLDIMNQIAIKTALRYYIDNVEKNRESECLKNYNREILNSLNKNQLFKY